MSDQTQAIGLLLSLLALAFVLIALNEIKNRRRSKRYARWLKKQQAKAQAEREAHEHERAMKARHAEILSRRHKAPGPQRITATRRPANELQLMAFNGWENAREKAHLN